MAKIGEQIAISWLHKNEASGRYPLQGFRPEKKGGDLLLWGLDS
jgi:hypothetical protein